MCRSRPNASNAERRQNDIASALAGKGIKHAVNIKYSAADDPSQKQTEVRAARNAHKKHPNVKRYQEIRNADGRGHKLGAKVGNEIKLHPSAREHAGPAGCRRGKRAAKEHHTGLPGAKKREKMQTQAQTIKKSGTTRDTIWRSMTRSQRHPPPGPLACPFLFPMCPNESVQKRE